MGYKILSKIHGEGQNTKVRFNLPLKGFLDLGKQTDMLKVLSFRTNHDMMDLMAESVAHHQATLDINSPRDFTDAMLIEIQKTTDKDSSFYGDFGIENLKNVLFDLFLAGSETTSTTLTWAALYMVRYPQVQARVQAELDNVVGKNRRPAIADKPKLPYTEVNTKLLHTNV